VTFDDTSVNDAGSGAGSDDVAALRQERDELLDRLLRSAAEFDNYRKRTERERREIYDNAAADLFRDLLPIVDDLERALDAAAHTGDRALRDGVELIHKALIELLRRRNVEPFQAIGEPFDPIWHDAVAAEPANGRPDGEVIGEARRGYKIGDRLLRPAMVRVAKA
jgi:molecular chaperone GrpE